MHLKSNARQNKIFYLKHSIKNLIFNNIMHYFYALHVC